jgi:N-acetylneuraminic acid mutarotase
MIVWGGDDSYNFLSTGGRYNPTTNTWQSTSTNNVPDAREKHTAVWTGSKMIVWGGYYYDGTSSHYLNTGGMYDPITDQWVSTSTTDAPSGRDSHTAVWTGSQMIVWGGEIVENTGGIYDPITDQWVSTSTTDAPQARYFHTAVWTGSKMIVWVGDFVENTGGIYDPVTDQWVSTSTTDAPFAGLWHTAVWTGSKMIVWGGYDGNNLRNTGGIYTP